MSDDLRFPDVAKPKPKKSSVSPTQRTLKSLRAKGWPAEVVERWNPHARIRQDLFNCIDLVVLDDQQGVLGVQATSGANVSARAKKSAAEPALLAWLARGNRFQVWGWRELWIKTSAKAKKRIWECRVLHLSLDADGAIQFTE